MTRERMARFRPYVTKVFVTRGARHARFELLILPKITRNWLVQGNTLNSN